MEINLTIVFLAVLAIALINTVTFLLLNNRVLSLEKKSLKKIDNYSNQLEKDISDLLQTLKISFSDFKADQTDQLEKGMMSFKEQVDKILMQQQDSFKELKNKNEMYFDINNGKLKELNDLVSSGFTDTSKQFENRERSLSELLVVKLDELQKLTRQGIFLNNQKHLDMFEKLTKQVQMLRIENIIDITNELGKHTELQVVTDDFIKHLGDCKVLKIEDKSTGQFTKIFYENGIKRSSNTFSGDKLKYQMFFDENGKAERGVELNEKSEITFEYYYDEAGEINKRIEFNYDDAGKESLRKEIVY